MSIRMQRDINELKTRVEKLEAIVARLDASEFGVSSIKVKRRPGRPRKNGNLSAEQ